MDNLIGIGLLITFMALGIYPMSVEDFNYDTKYYLQLAVSGLGALYILSVANYKKVYLFFKNYGSSATVNDKQEEENMDYNQYAIKDLEYMLHFRHRATQLKSRRALEILVELNTIFFESDIVWPTEEMANDQESHQP